MLTDSGYISADSLPFEISNSLNLSEDAMEQPEPERKTMDLKDSASKAEYETIMHVLREVNFNKTKAAKLLNIDRKTLYNTILKNKLHFLRTLESFQHPTIPKERFSINFHQTVKLLRS